MRHSASDGQNQELMNKATEVSIRLFLVAALVYSCFLILLPFLMPVLWGVIIAVAMNPLYARLKSLLGGRGRLAGTLFLLIGLGAVVVPAMLLSDSFFDGVKWLTAQLQKNAVQVPPPPAGVADWPVIGERAYELWANASDNLEATLMRFGPQFKSLGTWLLSTLTGLGLGVLGILFSIVIAGVLLVHAAGGGRPTRSIGVRLVGDRGEAAVELAVQTIRSVTNGVIGVAAIQSLLAAIGLYLVDVPGAGLWAVLVLILSVAQLPPLIILGPASLYVIATSDSTVTIVLFTIWALLVSVSDSFLKPIFLGRGMEIPMPVILIGAIGGMLMAGIIGLFVGAVVLAFGYKLFMAWMDERKEPVPEGDHRI